MFQVWWLHLQKRNNWYVWMCHCCVMCWHIHVCSNHIVLGIAFYNSPFKCYSVYIYTKNFCFERMCTDHDWVYLCCCPHCSCTGHEGTQVCGDIRNSIRVSWSNGDLITSHITIDSYCIVLEILYDNTVMNVVISWLLETC